MDIVDRLRATAEMQQMAGFVALGDEAAEAAAEITRLRDERASIRGQAMREAARYARGKAMVSVRASPYNQGRQAAAATILAAIGAKECPEEKRK